MNKKTKNLVIFSAFCIFFGGISTFANTSQTPVRYKYRYNNIPIKQPVVTKSMAPAVAKYKKGDYLSAMLDLKKVTEKEKNNMYAKYYLALCYTQLGYRSEAEELYQEISSSDTNYSLVLYSKKALTCIDNPNDEICLPPKKITAKDLEKAQQKEETVVAEEKTQEIDDMTKFIRSGAKIHPAALDRINKERMERKIQADIYAKEHAQELKDGTNATK